MFEQFKNRLFIVSIYAVCFLTELAFFKLANKSISADYVVIVSTISMFFLLIFLKALSVFNSRDKYMIIDSSLCFVFGVCGYISKSESSQFLSIAISSLFMVTSVFNLKIIPEKNIS